MNDQELRSHLLVGRLKYLLARLEGEFFHIQPDLPTNGTATSVALSSILNEAVNLVEAVFPGPPGTFWTAIQDWASRQEWTWDEVVIRFTWFPVCEDIRPFRVDAGGRLTIEGRAANNAVKHDGRLASLADTLTACAAAWFLVLETAREARIILDPSDVDRVMRIFDLFDLLTIANTSHGPEVRRPMVSLVEYPIVRGQSEISIATAAFETRYDKWMRRRHRE